MSSLEVNEHLEPQEYISLLKDYVFLDLAMYKVQHQLKFELK